MKGEKEKRQRSTEEVAGAARRMIRALGERVGDEDPIDLRLIVDLKSALDEALLEAIRGQRAATPPFSYAEIAAGLGTSKQAVQQRLTRPSQGDVA